MTDDRPNVERLADKWLIERLRWEVEQHNNAARVARNKLAEVRKLADEWESTPREWICQSCAADNFGDAQFYVDALRAVLDREVDQ